MAYRRSLTTSARLLSRQRFAPSFTCTHHEDDRRNPHSDEKVFSFLQSRSYGCFGGMSYRDPKRSQFLHVPMTTSGFLLARNMSTMNGDGDGMTDVVADKTMEVMSSRTPVLGEVAVAAADSWAPVAAIQHVIDGIHIYTGLNWWASIVITTLAAKTLLLPNKINELKACSKLDILKAELDQLKQQMKDSDMSPAEGEERRKRLYKKHGVSQFTPIRDLLIQGSIYVSFFLAIQNMVEKVPSLQTGGISWFTDLTTPDTLYILPFLGAFSFWASIEAGMEESSKLNPDVVRTRNVFRGVSALTVPLIAIFPNALLCCWITSNCFSLVYRSLIKKPSVKKRLNITIIEPPPPESPTKQEKLAAALEVFFSKNAAAKRQGETNQTLTSSSLLSHKPASNSNYK